MSQPLPAYSDGQKPDNPSENQLWALFLGVLFSCTFFCVLYWQLSKGNLVWEIESFASQSFKILSFTFLALFGIDVFLYACNISLGEGARRYRASVWNKLAWVAIPCVIVSSMPVGVWSVKLAPLVVISCFCVLGTWLLVDLLPKRWSSLFYESVHWLAATIAVPLGIVRLAAIPVVLFAGVIFSDVVASILVIPILCLLMESGLGQDSAESIDKYTAQITLFVRCASAICILVWAYSQYRFFRFGTESVASGISKQEGLSKRAIPALLYYSCIYTHLLPFFYLEDVRLFLKVGTFWDQVAYYLQTSAPLTPLLFLTICDLLIGKVNTFVRESSRKAWRIAGSYCLLMCALTLPTLGVQSSLYHPTLSIVFTVAAFFLAFCCCVTDILAIQAPRALLDLVAALNSLRTRVFSLGDFLVPILYGILPANGVLSLYYKDLSNLFAISVCLVVLLFSADMQTRLAKHGFLVFASLLLPKILVIAGASPDLIQQIGGYLSLSVVVLSLGSRFLPPALAWCQWFGNTWPAWLGTILLALTWPFHILYSTGSLSSLVQIGEFVPIYPWINILYSGVLLLFLSKHTYLRDRALRTLEMQGLLSFLYGVFYFTAYILTGSTIGAPLATQILKYYNQLAVVLGLSALLLRSRERRWRLSSFPSESKSVLKVPNTERPFSNVTSGKLYLANIWLHAERMIATFCHLGIVCSLLAPCLFLGYLSNSAQNSVSPVRFLALLLQPFGLFEVPILWGINFVMPQIVGVFFVFSPQIRDQSRAASSFQLRVFVWWVAAYLVQEIYSDTHTNLLWLISISICFFLPVLALFWTLYAARLAMADQVCTYACPAPAAVLRGIWPRLGRISDLLPYFILALPLCVLASVGEEFYNKASFIDLQKFILIWLLLPLAYLLVSHLSAHQHALFWSVARIQLLLLLVLAGSVFLLNETINFFQISLLVSLLAIPILLYAVWCYHHTRKEIV